MSPVAVNVLHNVRKLLRVLTALAALSLIGFVLVRYYPYVFSKDVRGKVIRVERVTQVSAMINVEKVDPAQLYSFAVSMRTPDGTFWTAAGEDRQWAVVQPDQCVEARLYPYPPWDLQKSGTYGNARLLQIIDCAQLPPK